MAGVYAGESEAFCSGGDILLEACAFFLPKENVLPPARNDRGLVLGIAGMGMLSRFLGCGLVPSSKGMSVEEGRVDVEL